MKVEFERGLHNNYMVIKDTESKEDVDKNCHEDYQIRMLSGTGVEGFLAVKLRYFNGQAEFCYDISSKQRLSEWFKTKKLNYQVLCRILKNLCEVLENAMDYLLEVNHIILDPNYIFIDTEEYVMNLCYYPFYDEDILKSGQEFLQYLLEILDYNDKAAVEAGYEIFRLCMKDGFGIELLKNFLSEELKEKTMQEEAEEWNSVIPVSVMREEVEKECEQPVIPDLKPVLRLKICMVLFILEVIISLIFIPNLKGSIAAVLVYLVISILLLSVILILSVFYKNAERLTRLITVKGYITYNSKNAPYEYDTVWETETEAVEKETKEYEETVLLAYAGKAEKLRRLHYIGTRNQGDITITKYPFTVGKSDRDTDYCLSYPFVSRVHFRVDKEEDKYFITDTNSRNGLCINDESLNANETRELCVGDRVELGDLVFLFQ